MKKYFVLISAILFLNQSIFASTEHFPTLGSDRVSDHFSTWISKNKLDINEVNAYGNDLSVSILTDIHDPYNPTQPTNGITVSCDGAIYELRPGDTVTCKIKNRVVWTNKHSNGLIAAGLVATKVN